MVESERTVTLKHGGQHSTHVNFELMSMLSCVCAGASLLFADYEEEEEEEMPSGVELR